MELFIRMCIQSYNAHNISYNSITYALLTSYYASKLIKCHFLKSQPQVFDVKSDNMGGAETPCL